MPADAAVRAEYLKRLRARARHGISRTGDLLGGVHDEALRFVQDPARLVAVLGTRRASKSRSWIRRMLHDATTIKDGRVAYVNETMAECERIAWVGNGRDGILTLNDELGLRGNPNNSKHIIRFPSGGQIELLGADDKRQINKLRGSPYHLIVVDEAQKMPHLDPLLLSILGPSMMDYQGQIALSGSPGEDLVGLFYEITRPDPEPKYVARWSRHFINVLDNPFFGATREDRFRRTIQAFCDEFGLELDDPRVRREWFGEWVKEDARFVYAVHKLPEHELCYADYRVLPDGTPDFDAHLAALPKLPRGASWNFTLGADLGFDPDPFAYMIWAWSLRHPGLWSVGSWKKTRLLHETQLAILSALDDRFHFSLACADAGGEGKNTVAGWSEEWRRRGRIPFSEAEKHRKQEHQEWLNNDILARTVHLLRGEPFHEEAKRLTYLPRSEGGRFQLPIGRMKEDPRLANHATDAGLYGHRFTAAYLAQQDAPKPKKGTAAYYEALEARIEAEETEEDDDGERYLYPH